MIYVREIASNQDELTSTLSTGISINHLIAILSAPLGGWVWQRYGIGVLFSFAAVMAVCNGAIIGLFSKLFDHVLDVRPLFPKFAKAFEI